MALSCSPTRSTNSWRSSPKAHSKRAHSKKDSEREPTEDFPPRASGCASKVRDHRLADRRKDETVVAERRFPVDGKRRSQLARLARHHGRADCAPRSTGKSCRRCAQRRIPPCSSAGHGRFEPLPGSVADDLRQRAGISPASCSRLDGPGAGQGVRRQDRNSEDALHRLEQVGQHARTEHLQAVFFRKNQTGVGAEKAGSHFIAITDPGSKMQQVAERDKFRHIFFGRPSIGGRYSALSNFGMVPAAVIGMDMKKFLDRTAEMVRACGDSASVEENPGAVLGLILGTAAVSGRDKVPILTSPGISDLGAWLEQLLAESTGKVGKGIIPVDREELGAPEVYGHDRVFAYIRLETGPDAAQDAAVAAIEKAGHPVVRISMADTYDLGQEFFRWEIATAVAGSVIGINAFNQPDVEASKIVTKSLTSEYETKGSLPAEKPVLEDSGIKLFTGDKNAGELGQLAGGDKSLAGYLKAHLGRIHAGDYFALLGYIQMNAEHEQALQAMRHAVRDKKKVATCLGFGPRFLHSTGQAYKGGPNSGVFLQITCDDSVELPVPEPKYTFGVVKAAQARGDFQVLAERGRRALRVHLGRNVNADLQRLSAAIQKAIQ